MHRFKDNRRANQGGMQHVAIETTVQHNKISYVGKKQVGHHLLQA